MWALSNLASWNQMSHELETQPSRNLWVLVHCLAGSCNEQQKSSCSHKCVKAIVLDDFCGCNGKTSAICHRRIGWSSPSKQGSYSATDSTSWDGTRQRSRTIASVRSVDVASCSVSLSDNTVFRCHSGLSFFFGQTHLQICLLSHFSTTCKWAEWENLRMLFVKVESLNSMRWSMVNQWRISNE